MSKKYRFTAADFDQSDGKYPQQAQSLANIANAKLEKLIDENIRLSAKVDKWKSEYEELCKFTTDYENQRDDLRAQLAEARKELEKYK